MQITLILLGLAVLGLLILFTKLTHDANHIDAKQKSEDQDTKQDEDVAEKLVDSKNFLYTGIVVCFLLLAVITWLLVKDTMYAGHFQSWSNLIVRWMHITFGIAWIGTSFLFVFMENSLHANKNKPELKGDLWMVHGGGFWFVEKYKVAPTVMPKGLHWFKYEAYFTWITGFALLCVVYYFNAEAMLIDPNIMDMPTWMGIAIGIGSLIVGYGIYDGLSRTPLLKKPVWFGVVLFSILVGFAYFYCQVFNARAAYIHFGALIGTMMAGNVFFAIIPAQKALVKAAKDGTPLDPWLGQFASMRSFHNNYFTLPVLFVMISNHFPITFGHEYPWLILAALSIASGTLKHWLNLREQGQLSVWVFPISVLMLVSIIFISAPPKPGECKDEVTITEVYSIMQERCVTCHSSSPTDKVNTKAPNGVMYDTPQQIKKMADKIMQRAVITKTMPQNNSTGMLPEEREKLRCWIEQGANIEE